MISPDQVLLKVSNVPMLPVQREFLNAKELQVMLSAERVCGKSWIAIFSALVDMLKGKSVLYMAPTEDAFYKGAWVHLQGFLSEFGLLDDWSYNTDDKTGTLSIGKGIKSTFYVGTYDNYYETKNIYGCSTLYFDEFPSEADPTLVPYVSGCLGMRDNFGNRIGMQSKAVGTPYRKMNILWSKVFEDPTKYGGVIRVLSAKTSDNVFLTDAQREALASGMKDCESPRTQIGGKKC